MKRYSMEHNEQVTVIKWRDAVRSLYPELGLLHAIPNGGWRNPTTGALLKAEGVSPGVPDLCLPVARGGFHGLYIEMKSAAGTVRQAQKEWMKALSDQGYRAVVCRGAGAAIEEITEYLNGK